MVPAAAQELQANLEFAVWKVRHLLFSQDGGLCSSQHGNGNTIWGTTHISEGNRIKEVNGGWVTTMLATNPKLDLGTDRATLSTGNLYQLTNSFLVDALERVILINTFLHIFTKKLASIITRETTTHLGEIVGSKGEELGLSSDGIGNDSSAWHFNHGTNHVLHSAALFLHNSLSHSYGILLKDPELLHLTNQRDHNLRCLDRDASLLNLTSCLEDSTHLHIIDLRVGDTQAASTVTKHGVSLDQRLNPSLHLLKRDLQGSCKQLGLSTVRLVGHKLVKRRVEETDSDRSATHLNENAVEIFSLELK
mmetsp:Transcript_14005/g.25017  ORF Transcript_14005/g.25017 Transcript_14005/m.25017 type:complete len:307 (-) Transcript_14005:2031-2951(-)